MGSSRSVGYHASEWRSVAVKSLDSGRLRRQLSGEDRTRQPVMGATDYDPSVWTGRALQAENDDLEKFGLALLYPAY